MFIPIPRVIIIRRVQGIMEKILQPGLVPVQVPANVLPVASSETSSVVVEVPTEDRIARAVLLPAAAVLVNHLPVAAVQANHRPVAAAAEEEDPKLL